MVSQAQREESCPADRSLVTLHEAVGRLPPAEDGSEASSLSPPLGEMQGRNFTIARL